MAKVSVKPCLFEAQGRNGSLEGDRLTLSLAANHATALCLLPSREDLTMEEHQIGWIAAIIVGGIAGWLAEQFMKSEMGLVMNIVLGIIGAAVASWLMGFLGISLGGGWIGYLIAGFIGACILIAVARAFSGAFQRT